MQFPTHIKSLACLVLSVSMESLQKKLDLSKVFLRGLRVWIFSPFLFSAFIQYIHGQLLTTIHWRKNKRKFYSFIRKFRWERLQSHMYMRKGFLIYEKMRKYLVTRWPLVKYDFATAPLWISLYTRKILFSVLSMYLQLFRKEMVVDTL